MKATRRASLDLGTLTNSFLFQFFAHEMDIVTVLFLTVMLEGTNGECVLIRKITTQMWHAIISIQCCSGVVYKITEI